MTAEPSLYETGVDLDDLDDQVKSEYDSYEEFTFTGDESDDSGNGEDSDDITATPPPPADESPSILPERPSESAEERRRDDDEPPPSDKEEEVDDYAEYEKEINRPHSSASSDSDSSILGGDSPYEGIHFVDDMAGCNKKKGDYGTKKKKKATGGGGRTYDAADDDSSQYEDSDESESDLSFITGDGDISSGESSDASWIRLGSTRRRGGNKPNRLVNSSSEQEEGGDSGKHSSSSGEDDDSADSDDSGDELLSAGVRTRNVGTKKFRDILKTKLTGGGMKRKRSAYLDSDDSGGDGERTAFTNSSKTRKNKRSNRTSRIKRLDYDENA